MTKLPEKRYVIVVCLARSFLFLFCAPQLISIPVRLLQVSIAFRDLKKAGANK